MYEIRYIMLITLLYANWWLLRTEPALQGHQLIQQRSRGDGYEKHQGELSKNNVTKTATETPMIMPIDPKTTIM